MKNQLDTLFAKDMTRKEFLQYIGGALLVAFGVTNLIKSLLGNQQAGQRAPATRLDYGGNVYGGAKNTSL